MKQEEIEGMIGLLQTEGSQHLFKRLRNLRVQAFKRLRNLRDRCVGIYRLIKINTIYER